ncbi:unnamed protein product [Ceratitis capitata]|uniref:(Mediterranean fruit fly) hypothetical protein n=1 Tax=Ceratitis capitata TaxID=7213 RepID=A0A811V2D5_CERCA|nr:unnamed protein product [Ceratitis capitata]
MGLGQISTGNENIKNTRLPDKKIKKKKHKNEKPKLKYQKIQKSHNRMPNMYADIHTDIYVYVLEYPQQLYGLKLSGIPLSTSATKIFVARQRGYITHIYIHIKHNMRVYV